MESPFKTKSSRPPAAEDPLVGRLVGGKFEILSLLGAGAMGAVYLARQTALDKKVAIKILHRELATDAKFAQRFRREAMAASRLDHPSSIRVFDFGEDPDGILYIAMEYVQGTDLFSVIERRGLLPREAILDVMIQTLGALIVAHAMGVLHRDLKPENILVVPGKTEDGSPCDLIKVCDFGIAKILEPQDAPGLRQVQGRKLSTAGLVIGTPAYMSPEQARGVALDARSDLYSIGVVLYHLLAGRVPFEASTAMDLVMKQISEAPRPPSSIVPGIDPALEAVCLKALSKDPAARYQDAREMRMALRALVEGGPPVSVGALGGSRSPSPLEESPTLEIGTLPTSGPTLAAVSPTRVEPARRLHWRVALPPLGLLACGLLLVRYQSGLPAVTANQARAAAPSLQVVPSVAEKAPVGPSEPPRIDPAPADRRGVPREATPPARPAAHPQSKVPREPAAGSAAPPTITMETSIAPPRVESSQAAAPSSTPTVVTPEPTRQVPPPFEVENARVEIGSVSNILATTPSNVNRALSGIGKKLTECYRAALPAMPHPLEGSFVLHVETGLDGTITEATFEGAKAGGLAGCVVETAIGRKIPNVDTGSASADVSLVLISR